jgi:transposase-like protein
MRKQRKFTSEVKAGICLQILSGAKTTAQVCRENKLNENLVSRWKKQFIENASMVFEKESSQTSEDERVAELERMVGRLTMELEIAKKASQSLGQLLTKNGR